MPPQQLPPMNAQPQETEETPPPALKPLQPVWGGQYSEQDQQSAMQFFAVFSRFEFALKTSGFARNNRGAADVAWKGYSQAIDQATQGMVHDTVVQAAVDFLCQQPPKRQVVEERHGRPYAKYPDAVRPAEPKTDLSTALLIAKDVRNNLFHGGKLMNEQTDPDRNRNLIRHSLVVLAAALPIVDEVRINYWTG